MHKYKSYITVGIVPQEHEFPLQIIIPIGTLINAFRSLSLRGRIKGTIICLNNDIT